MSSDPDLPTIRSNFVPVASGELMSECEHKRIVRIDADWGRCEDCKDSTFPLSARAAGYADPDAVNEALTTDAIAAGATHRWVTREGYTRLPPEMTKKLGGTHVWFLRAKNGWEAWPEELLNEALGGSPSPKETDWHARAEELASAIRKHRDEKGHDRCWLDDVALYAVLGEEKSDGALPPRAEFLSNCERYYEVRSSKGEWNSTSERDRAIAEATEAKLEVARAHAALDRIYKYLIVLGPTLGSVEQVNLCPIDACK